MPFSRGELQFLDRVSCHWRVLPPAPFQSLKTQLIAARLAPIGFFAKAHQSKKTPLLDRKALVRQLHELGYAAVHHFHKGSWIDPYPEDDHGQRHESYCLAHSKVRKK